MINRSAPGATKALRGSVTRRVEDLLESMDEAWFTTPQLVAEYEARWGPVDEAAITQATYRLRKRGAVRVSIQWVGNGRSQK